MIKEKVKEFLNKELNLKLSSEKTKITHMKNGYAKFLGTQITLRKPKESKIINRVFKGRKEKVRLSGVRPYLYAPIKEIIAKLEKTGFLKPKNVESTVLIPKAQNK